MLPITTLALPDQSSGCIGLRIQAMALPLEHPFLLAFAPTPDIGRSQMLPNESHFNLSILGRYGVSENQSG